MFLNKIKILFLRFFGKYRKAKTNFILTKIKKKKQKHYIKKLNCFILIFKSQLTTNDITYIKSIFLILHKRKYQPCISYHKKPFYSALSYRFTKFISKWFRTVLFIPPTIQTIKLINTYEETFKWYFLATITVILFVLNTINFIKDIIYKLRVKAHIKSITDCGSIIIRYGVPGAGKTSSMFSDLKVVADLRWKKITNEYKLYKPYLKDIAYWQDELREDAEEIVEAYEFYTKSKTYPCFWSTVPAFVDRVPLNRLTADHLLQRKKLPYGTVAICDEMSLIMPQELHHNRPIEVKELCKFPRHIGDLSLGTTEQGKDNMLNDFRNSASEFKCMVKQEWVLKPKFLIKCYDFLLKHTKLTNRLISNFFRIWQKINNSIGYRKYFYYDSGTADNVKKTDIKTFITPSVLSVTYDDRAFRNIYRCKHKKLEISCWSHLRLSKQELDDIFTKELEERAKSKEQRKAEAKAKRLAKEGKDNEV